MLGNYPNQPDTTIGVADFDPDNQDQRFALHQMTGKEVEGPSYSRQSNSDLKAIGDGYYILEWRPVVSGEIWSFMALTMYENYDDDVPTSGLKLPTVVVLYGSLKGSYYFKIKNQAELEADDKIRKISP